MKKKKNKKIKNKNSNKGRTVALILLIVVLIILGFLSVNFFKNLKDDNSKTLKDEDMVTTLTLMGEQLYSEYYYKEESRGKSSEEMVEYLKKYETVGLKFDLTQLEKYNDDYKKTIKKFIKENNNCKKDETMVIIYPKSPYTNKDFISEISLNCEVKKK